MQISVVPEDLLHKLETMQLCMVVGLLPTPRGVDSNSYIQYHFLPLKRRIAKLEETRIQLQNAYIHSPQPLDHCSSRLWPEQQHKYHSPLDKYHHSGPTSTPKYQRQPRNHILSTFPPATPIPQQNPKQLLPLSTPRRCRHRSPRLLPLHHPRPIQHLHPQHNNLRLHLRQRHHHPL